MRQDGFDRAVARAEHSFSKLVRIREGIENLEPDDVLGINRGVGRVGQVQRKDGQPRERSVEFNRPVTRSYRLTNAAGATSFHFQHRAISKVMHEMNEGGLRNRPGAARAHARYVEREMAVATIETENGVDLTTTIVTGAASIDDRPSAAITRALSTPISNVETDNDYDWHRYLGFNPRIARRLVDDLAGPQPGPAGSTAYGFGQDAETNAGVWLLSRRDLVRQGRGSHGHLPSAQDLVSLASGSTLHRLRDAASHIPSQREITAGIATLPSAGEAPDHDRYIGRMEAVAIQPDGTRALITNIDQDDEERARFWSLVEEHEAVASNDQMSLRVSDQPTFWAAVSSQPDCPAELMQALGTNTPDQTIRFEFPRARRCAPFSTSNRAGSSRPRPTRHRRRSLSHPSMTGEKGPIYLASRILVDGAAQRG